MGSKMLGDFAPCYFNLRMSMYSFGLPVRSTIAAILMLAATVLGCISTSYAMGFGTLTLKSHLSEKFNADVPLLLAGAETMKKLNVSVASMAEYRQMGLPWQQQLKMIRVEIHGRHTDLPYLTLS